KVLIVVGAAYLAWLAYKALQAGFAKEGGLAHVDIKPAGSAFRDGFTVQITNPKILLFFGAVLPPFLDFSRPLPAQFVMFAAATVALDVIATTAYGFGGAALASRMAEPRFRRGFSVAVAAVLVAAAGLIVSRL
ncbi:MAG: LysE family translocator, partial [Caulobacteraceae bacterium]|nr:LysE family translocator [Caulobacteraceae bacterium]